MAQTEPLFIADAYLTQAQATVLGQTEEGGILVDRSVFYAAGGGQPGDTGWLDWDGGTLAVSDTIKSGRDGIALMPEAGAPLPPVGSVVHQRLDWGRRHRLMRMHTCLHLLSVVVPLPVSGGAIADGKGRLDFNMPDAPGDKEALQHSLQSLIDQNLVVSETWITDAELDANPGLVKTMSVVPPRGVGRIRLVRIGPQDAQIDLQPCGGTHVAATAEIGEIRIGKIEKKGRQNRRIYVHQSDGTF